MIFGLVGKKLSHSFSPRIHKELGGYDYLLFEKSEDELKDFIKNGEWDALNVTVPYKKTVYELCDRIDKSAERVGCVNTLTKRNGKICGYNTDVYGFCAALSLSGVDVFGKSVAVLGSGGASAAVCEALKEFGAEPFVISRTGKINYGTPEKYKDTDILVNATPVGMYPDFSGVPVDIDVFSNLSAVFDVIYNPLKTRLLCAAKEKGIPVFSGMPMLYFQAARSYEIFFDTKLSLSEDEIKKCIKKLEFDMANIVLIGMPGCGKSETAKTLAKRLCRECIDIDDEIAKRADMSIPDIFSKYGEEYFRNIEREVTDEISQKSGVLISCGGGTPICSHNREKLMQNGIFVYLVRDTKDLAVDARPLSIGAEALEKIEKERAPVYEKLADFSVLVDDDVNITAERIYKAFGDLI
ncbi:MAG: hypothetical protein J5922_04800 [Clostridia bacterium]|nr:hypothetical protein [Clostridia bacterium]